MIITINETAITITIDTQSNITEAYSVSAILLSENKIFIAYNQSNSIVYGVVCIIEGTTITVGTQKSLSNMSNSYQNISLPVVLSENKVFITYYGTINNTDYLYGTVCTISGITITAGTATQLSSTINSGVWRSAVKLSKNKVFIAYSYGGNNSYLYSMICIINNTVITAGTDTELSTVLYTKSIIAINISDNIFIACCNFSYDYLHGLFIKNNKSILPVTSTSQSITGVAKKKGISGEIIPVYVPDI